MEPNFLFDEGGIIYALVDLDVYPMAVVLRVAHRFTGRCYLHLQQESPGKVGVRFRGKKGADCTGIAGDFFNDLLDQAVRQLVGAETEDVRNLILAHALSQTTLLHPELEIADPLEDPLGIGKQDEK